MITCLSCGESFPATREFFYPKDANRYSRKCKKCSRAEAKLRYAADPEKARARMKKRYWRDPDSRRNDSASWRRNNPEKALAQSRKWQTENRDKYRAVLRKALQSRRAKLAGYLAVPYTVEQVLNMYGTDCHICETSIDLSAPRRTGTPGWESGLHIDHVLAIANGGQDSIENVRPAHGKCNLRKHAKMMSDLVRTS